MHADGRVAACKKEQGGTLVEAFAQNDPLVLFTGTDLVDPASFTGWATMRQTKLNIERPAGVKSADTGVMTPTLPTPLADGSQVRYGAR